MAAQTLGKLWVSLRPTKEEHQDVGSCLAYQQQIILEVIEQFGFDQQVFIQPPPHVSERPSTRRALIPPPANQP